MSTHSTDTDESSDNEQLDYLTLVNTQSDQHLLLAFADSLVFDGQLSRHFLNELNLALIHK